MTYYELRLVIFGFYTTANLDPQVLTLCSVATICQNLKNISGLAVDANFPVTTYTYSEKVVLLSGHFL